MSMWSLRWHSRTSPLQGHLTVLKVKLQSVIQPNTMVTYDGLTEYLMITLSLIHNFLPCWRIQFCDKRRIESWDSRPLVTCAEKSAKFGCVVPEICWRINRQTESHTHTHTHTWGLAAGYQPRPHLVDRGTTTRYGSQLRYKRVSSPDK